MKQLIMINGTMGAGKSTVCKALNQRLTHSVWLDGDWCWMADPFVVNDETKNMVLDNITHMLRNFLKQKEYEHVIFCWVMDEDDIINSILERLKDLEYRCHKITLCLQDATLMEHLTKDIKSGIRSKDCIEKSLARQKKYKSMSTTKLFIDGKEVEEVVIEIEKMIEE